MKKYAGYVRVSTNKQGLGVSLQEQRDAIVRYCAAHQLKIEQWFEEKRTAAKGGRPVFMALLRLLQQRKLDGVVIHKIDRGARNLRDWAFLGELIDQNIEVHFANESLDLLSRGGRLSADIQAVVAADYIRNLREETRKGFYGRIKQGLFPLPAPIGYMDNGKGRPKTPDPVMAPLVRRAFEAYATGMYSLHGLRAFMTERGLRNRQGSPLTLSGLANMLHNPFYIGLIRLKRTGEIFQGCHAPLISKSTYDRVQDVLQGKVCRRVQHHAFTYRRMFVCGLCGYSLIGERQKGHVYLRCHTRDCATKSIREDALEAKILEELQWIELSESEKEEVRQRLQTQQVDWIDHDEQERKALTLRKEQVTRRIHRLTDAFVDGSIEQALYNERKKELLDERLAIEEQLASSDGQAERRFQSAQEYLELAGSARLSLIFANPDEKRDLVESITSNRTVTRKTIVVKLREPFHSIAERQKTQTVSRIGAYLELLTSHPPQKPAQGIETA